VSYARAVLSPNYLLRGSVTPPLLATYLEGIPGFIRQRPQQTRLLFCLQNISWAACQISLNRLRLRLHQSPFRSYR